MIICRFSDDSNMRNEGKSRIKKYTLVGCCRRRKYTVKEIIKNIEILTQRSRRKQDGIKSKASLIDVKKLKRIIKWIKKRPV